MNRVIKSFEKFGDEMQEEIYASYLDGALERATFPFKGEIAEGVIFESEDTMFLIPTTTIKASRLGGSDDDDNDNDGDDLNDDDGGIEVDDDSEDFEDEE